MLEVNHPGNEKMDRVKENKVSSLLQHELRQTLHDEIHLRPGLPIATPSQLTSLTVIDATASEHRVHLAEFIARHDLAPMRPDAVHYRAQLPDYVLRWSLHGEFARITVVQERTDCTDFERTALACLPEDWRVRLPGRVLAAINTIVLSEAQSDLDLVASSQRWFAGNALVGAQIAHGKGIAVSDLQLHHDALIDGGAMRLLLLNKGMSKRMQGRMLQDLFEMETYRLLTLLGFPLAKRLLPLLTRIEENLQTITNAIAQGQDPVTLQHELDAAAAELEDAIAGSHARFSATRAYASLFAKRMQDLHEHPLENVASFTEFMDRRMGPALTTCETVRTRLQELSLHVTRTSSLLRNRIELDLLKQNQGLLAALNRRAQAQLRLQQTVEGLSVVVLGYYTTSLLHRFLEALHHLGVPVDPDLAAGMAVPAVLLLLWWGLRKMHKKLLAAN